jgi:hypothetical protein
MLDLDRKHALLRDLPAKSTQRLESSHQDAGAAGLQRAGAATTAMARI